MKSGRVQVAKTVRAIALLVLVAFGALAGGLLPGPAQAAEPWVGVLELKGVINPVSARYIDRALTEAEDGGAVAAAILLDTPGGLESSMRDIVQRILNARIPVIVYVYPPGGRAASAGAFITMAAHVAAMAPDTAIGAAHPVGLGTGQADNTVIEKATNDAAAFMRSLAQRRGRNADWAERAVRDSISSNADEALRDRVVDVVAPDLGSLLRQVDGREVQLAVGRVTLRTADARPVNLEMNLIERFFLAITDPNVAYLLLTLAILAIYFELANPGAVLPGVIGGISLLLGLLALGMLPVNLVGLLLLAFAFLLFIAEIWVTSHGVLTIGGLISLVLGSLLLFNPGGPLFAVSLPVIIGVTLTMGAMMALTVGAIVRGQRRRPYTGLEALVGQVATARTVLNPAGLVFVNGELWDARSLDGRVEPGEEVKIEEVKGPTLLVRRVHPPEVKVLPGEEKSAPPEAEELPEPAIVQKEGANA